MGAVARADLPPDLRGRRRSSSGGANRQHDIARAAGARMKTVGIRGAPLRPRHFDEVLAPSAIDARLPTCGWLILASAVAGNARMIDPAARAAARRGVRQYRARRDRRRSALADALPTAGRAPISRVRAGTRARIPLAPAQRIDPPLTPAHRTAPMRAGSRFSAQPRAL